MKVSACLLGSLLLVVVLAQDPLVPDFSYVARGEAPLTYAYNANDQPQFKWPRTHSRDHLNPQYRYDTSKCTAQNMAECSAPFMSPNPKNVSVEVASILPEKNFLHHQKANNLHLHFAAICNHDVARYGWNSGFTSSLLDWSYADLTRTDPQFDWDQFSGTTFQGRETVHNTTAGSKLSMIFRLTTNKPANGTGPGTGKPKNTQTNGPTCFDLDPIYGNNGAGAGVDGDTVVKNRMNATTGEFLYDQAAVREGVPLPNTALQFILPNMIPVLNLFVMEHNDYAQKLRQRNSSMSGTTIFRLARRWTIAVYQSITFYEYAPIIFSSNMPVYDGYDAALAADLKIPAEIIMICHYPYSEIGGFLYVLDENYEPMASDIPVRGNLGNRTKVLTNFKRYKSDNILRGLIMGVQDPCDLYFSDGVRMVGLSGQASSDVFARMIARSRDAGLPSYNDIRASHGFPRLTNSQWDQISPDLSQEQIDALRYSYKNDINAIDFWVGGLAEYRSNSHMGPLWTKIYKQYWIDLRNADKWWFENVEESKFTEAEVSSILNTKISSLILKHFPTIKKVPCASFFSGVPDCPTGKPQSCRAAANDPNSAFLASDLIELKWTNASSSTSITTANVTFTIRAATTGFVAFGVAKTPGRMIGTHAFISTVRANTPAVRGYLISARQPCSSKSEGVCEASQGTGGYRWGHISGTETDGVTTMTLWVSGFPVNRTVDIVASFGDSDDLAYHGVNKGTGQIFVGVNAPVTPAPTPVCTAPPTPAPTPCPTVAPCATTAVPTACPACPTTAPTKACQDSSASALKVTFLFLLSLFVLF